MRYGSSRQCVLLGIIPARVRYFLSGPAQRCASYASSAFGRRGALRAMLVGGPWLGSKAALLLRGAWGSDESAVLAGKFAEAIDATVNHFFVT